MAIQVLSQETIDKIAAGEVVERPSSVIKELVENSIDARATTVTVEIRDGGTSFIRVTDNGCGISKNEIALAFLRHSTSKITSAEDLVTVATLGFRGEALSSISAVAQVELLTKTRDSFTGVRYCIAGGIEKSLEEVGTPDGTTFLVRNLFYNTPARKKFLKTNTTEGSYIQDLMERLALSHPEISFKLINNNQMKLHTSGNGSLKDIIYQIYGMDIAKNVIPVEYETEEGSISGYIGKPLISRGNRQYENYFVNGRYVKNNIVTKAIEQGYKNYLMQHKYPFTVLNVHFHEEELDVNVHPTKMELRFSNGEKVYRLFYQAVSKTLQQMELVPAVELSGGRKEKMPEKRLKRPPESFEKKRLAREREVQETKEVSGIPEERKAVASQDSGRPLVPSRERSEGTKLLDSLQTVAGRIKAQERSDAHLLNASLNAALEETGSPDKKYEDLVRETMPYQTAQSSLGQDASDDRQQHSASVKSDEEQNNGQDIAVKETFPQAVSVEGNTVPEEGQTEKVRPRQLNLFEEQVIERRVEDEVRIIGQIFDTYWILQFEDKMFLVDQHAAHEKVLYERTMAQLENRESVSQLLSPPLILTLSAREIQLLEQYRKEFELLGFQLEAFGGREYAINAVPANLFGLQAKELFMEMLDALADELGRAKPDMILEKIASMSCKAAIKGNQKISRQEAQELLIELMALDNPYHCPHGRPVMISMSKYELEKKFKRIV